MNIDNFLFSEKIIFVVGNSRSGTTVLAKLLSYSGKVCFFEELHFFEQLWIPHRKHENSLLNLDEAKHLAMKLYSIQYDGYFQTYRNLKRWENLANELISYMHNNNIPLHPVYVYGSFLYFETKKKGKIIPCDQTPRNVFYIKEILHYFPNAKIINIIRDPRDVLLSQKYRWKLKFLGVSAIPYSEAFRCWINYHPIVTTKLWVSSVLAYQKYVKDRRVYNIYFEKLVKEPHQEIQKLCKFLEIPFRKEMLLVEQLHSSTEDNRIKKRGLDPNKVGKWKRGGLNSTEIYLCQKIADNLMKRHGYQIVNIKPNIFMLLYYYLILPIKLFLMVIVNMKKIKSLKEAVNRRFSDF